MKTIKYFLKISILLVLLCSTVPLYSADEPYDFKGLELGSDISVLNQDKRFTCQAKNSPIADKSCYLLEKYKASETIADVPITSITLHYLGDQLATIVITFKKTHFSRVADAFKRAYDLPSTTKVETYVNRKYNLFYGYIYAWDNNIALIDAIEHYSNPDLSAIIYKRQSY